jgi:hypothetical protein
MTAIPHRVSEDDIHDGYLIPKGALVLTNIWLVLLFVCIQYINQIERQVHAQ